MQCSAWVPTRTGWCHPAIGAHFLLQFPHLLKVLSFIQALLASDTSLNASMTWSDVSRVSASTVWCLRSVDKEKKLHYLITHSYHLIPQNPVTTSLVQSQFPTLDMTTNVCRTGEACREHSVCLATIPWLVSAAQAFPTSADLPGCRAGSWVLTCATDILRGSSEDSE